MTDSPKPPNRPAGAGAGGPASEFGATTHTTAVKRPQPRFFDKYLPKAWADRRLRKRRRIATMSRPKRIGRRVGVVSTWLLAGLALLMVVSAFAVYRLSDVPKQESVNNQLLTIEYSDGSVLAQTGTNRTLVPLSQISENAQWAVIAAEDRNFYSEPGVSVTGIARAVVNDVTGGDTQGGSGLTQQYVKNAYLNSDRTISRKLREIAISVKLSRNYSKSEILEYYLNTVYFGRGAWGVEAASEAYFGVHASQLNVAQGALLAAVLRSPTYYDPANNPTESKARWDYVIEGLVETKHLTTTTAAATGFPPTIPPSEVSFTGPNALIAKQVTDELVADDGISEDQVQAGGLVVKTTIDRNAQTAAVNAVNSTFSKLTAAQKNMKNALVAEDPSTGAVLAYYGGPNGKDYAGTDDQFDYAVGLRPPGSTFKPFVLATALKQTLAGTATPPVAINSVVDGSYKVEIPGTGTTISNDPSDETVSGPKVTVANAMKYSLNTTFDLMANTVGPAKVADTAHDAGIARTVGDQNTLVDKDGSTNFGVGIGDYPVRPIDMATGFATLANAGKTNPPYFVSSVTNLAGDTIFKHTAATTVAFDPKVANDVTLTMEPIASSSGFALAGGRVSAAKTGTEGIQSSKTGANSDAWTVGFTPQVAAAVWVGSGDSTHAIVNSAGAAEYGKDLPGRTWKAFMDAYLKGKPNLPLATKQQISEKGAIVDPTPTPVPSATIAAPTSSDPTTEAAPTPKPAVTPAPTPVPTIVPTPVPTQKPTPTPLAGAPTTANAG